MLPRHWSRKETSQQISANLQENLEELATLESLDNGKPYSMAKAADVPLVSHLYPEISSCPIWSPGSLGAILQLHAPTL